MLEPALSALLEQRRRAEIGVAYARAYAEQPVDEPDAWGDPVAFAEAAARL